ncbi:MAG: tol-pal system-associated acyl-CoA thioesterase [Methylotenera sp.]|uniref:tol-pal system-associated acyl-CoA thioesterase n=2 Tax=Methylotenera sp. TaxID=2051956 RepID=UPI00272F283B|nr:tol-pal system-associated acyl-CoA thioesterase [Methylotenera sp.]MDP1524154.1 tol-pal system-associated acyl-CoA thioesterase [Methylotenera sp.]
MSNNQFCWPVRVYYEDTDAGGVVYHSNYLNFMERARTEWLRDLGFEQTTVKDELGVIIVIHSLSIAFKSPAKFNDMLVVNCALIRAGHSSMVIMQSFTRDGVLLIDAQVKAVFVNAENFKPVAIPQAIKQAIMPIND